MSSTRLFVSKIPWTVSHAELRRYFQEFGRVVRATVVFDRNTGISKGYGFVYFAEKSASEQVFNQKLHELDGWKVDIQVKNNN